MSAVKPPKSILVTGAGGYIGGQLVKGLARLGTIPTIVAMDVRETPAHLRVPGVIYEQADIRDKHLAELMRRHSVESVAHLAAIVNSKGKDHEQEEYAVDVLGTENVLKACLKAGVQHIALASSGAAYGYWADNAPLLSENDPIRGNDEFPYSRHKRLVEEMLAAWRNKHPELNQLIFRPCTVLGPAVKNQITAIWEGPVVLGLTDADTPFVFVSDEDVVACFIKGLVEKRSGIYNLAGDGVMTLREVAKALEKPFIGIPSQWLAEGLSLARQWNLAPWGPEQVRFLQYRPVLSNALLKTEFGHHPKQSSREVFAAYAKHLKPNPASKILLALTG